MPTADDMGLGKTLTMISLVLKQKQLKPKEDEEEEDKWRGREKQLQKGETQQAGEVSSYLIIMCGRVWYMTFLLAVASGLTI